MFCKYVVPSLNVNLFISRYMKLYTKQELALLYFPNAKPHAATNMLADWIRRCTELRQQLALTGYRPKQRTFTMKQLKLIYEYLGEPG